VDTHIERACVANSLRSSCKTLPFKAARFTLARTAWAPYLLSRCTDPALGARWLAVYEGRAAEAAQRQYLPGNGAYIAGGRGENATPG